MQIDYNEVEKHARKAVVLVLGRKHPDLEDAVQDSLFRVFRHQDKFDGRCLLSTWVFRIAHNQAMSVILRKPPTVSLGDNIPKMYVDDNLEEAVEPVSEEQVVRSYLPKIGKKERLTIEGTLDGKSTDQLCEEIGVTENALYAMRSRGQKKLRDIIWRHFN